MIFPVVPLPVISLMIKDFELSSLIVMLIVREIRIYIHFIHPLVVNLMLDN